MSTRLETITRYCDGLKQNDINRSLFAEPFTVHSPLDQCDSLDAFIAKLNEWHQKITIKPMGFNACFYYEDE